MTARKNATHRRKSTADPPPRVPLRGPETGVGVVTGSANTACRPGGWRTQPVSAVSGARSTSQAAAAMSAPKASPPRTSDG